MKKGFAPILVLAAVLILMVSGLVFFSKNFPSKPTSLTQETLESSSKEVLGIKDGRLVKYSLKDKKISDLGVKVPSKVFRISPDKKRIFMASQNITDKGVKDSDVVFYVYDVSGKKLYVGKPQLSEKFTKLGYAKSTGFGNDYYAWDNDGQGLIYYITEPLPLTKAEEQGIPPNKYNMQIRHISLSENTDQTIYESRELDVAGDNVLISYNPNVNIVFAGSVGEPGISLDVIKIDVRNKSNSKLNGLVSTGRTSYDYFKRISNNSNLLIGFKGYPNFNQKVFSIEDNKEVFDPSSLIKFPQTDYPSLDYVSSYFVDNSPVFISWEQIKDEKGFVSIPSKAYFINLEDKKVSTEISFDKYRFDYKKYGTFMIMDATADSTILIGSRPWPSSTFDTGMVIENGKFSSLPDNFGPLVLIN